MTVPPRIPVNCPWPSTDWNEVGAAARPNDTASKAALANLCLRYWFPIYAFIRRRGTPEATAQDLTQAFFARIVEKPLARADPQKGSFRSYLRETCRNFLIDRWKQGSTDILNGPVVSLGALEPPAPDPEEEFDLDWAFAVLTNALGAVRDRYEDRGKAALFDRLRPYLPLHDAEPPRPQAKAAAELGMDVGAFKKALYDLRAVFAKEVRKEVARTLSDPSTVEEEIQNLLAHVRHLPSAPCNRHPNPEARQ
jgi:RNA polymerase sigma-70 factor (ECF subfamily)